MAREMYEKLDKCTARQADGRMNERMVNCLDTCDGWMDKLLESRLDNFRDGWTNRFFSFGGFLIVVMYK